MTETHPVQVMRESSTRRRRISTAVTKRAYEVYQYLYGPQQAIIEGECRGGFGVGELIAFLYAYPFPREEWRKRVDEAMRDMEGL